MAISGASSIAESINTLLNAYRAQLNRPLNVFKARKSVYEQVNSALSILDNYLDILQDLSVPLKTTGTTSVFNSKSASSSDTSMVTATAENEASAGVHTISISQLAKNHNQVSDEFSNTGTDIWEVLDLTGDGHTDADAGNYIFQIAVAGTTTDITVKVEKDDTNETILTNIASAINSSDAKINATVIHQTSSDSRLILTAEETGNADTLLIKDTDIAVSGNLAIKTGIHNAQSTEPSKHYAYDGTNLANTDLGLTSGESKDYIFSISINGITADDIKVNVSYDDTNETVLKSIRDTINASSVGTADNGVTVTLTGEGTADEYITIASKNSGDLFSIQDITLNLTEKIEIRTTQEKDNSSGGYIYKDTELNSKFILNELDMERTSNTVTDAVTGMTFNLLKVQTSPDVTIQVSGDVDTVKATVNSFIDQYNGVLEYLYNTTRIEKNGDDEFEGGPLSGEYFYKNLIWKLRELMAEKVEGVTNENYELLSNIGITADASGKLSISDSAKFEEALAEDTANVSDLFNSTEGKAAKLHEFIQNYVKLGGYIDNSEDAYDDRIEYLDTRISRMEASIDRKVETYRTKLGRMQEMMAMLQGQYMMLMMYYGLPTGTNT